MFRAYHENEDQYSGSTLENFDRKYALFEDRCDQSDLFEEDRSLAFSIMLCDWARQFYIDNCRGKDDTG